MSKIYINDTGQGFPLVLVHGYLGSSEMWCFQRDYLSNYLSKYAKNKNVWKIINIFIITFMSFLILFILKEMIS